MRKYAVLLLGSATADTTEHKKEATVSLLADTKKAIETAYATKGGKQA